MEIAKAVVLAGDCPGAETWPSLGGPAARQLAPVANRPVLFHHLDALARAGVREAAVVTDATTRASIREALRDGSSWGLALTHVEHDGNPNVLASSPVADFVGSDPVLVQHGDVLVRERLSALHDDFTDHGLDVLILSPACGQAGDAGGPAGYIIGPDIHLPMRREAAALDDVLQRLRSEGARIGVRAVDACMPCRGGADALLEANRWILEQLPLDHRSAGERVFASKIQGPVALHPSAEIRSSVVRGPVAIGPGARIVNAYVGPYTSIGAGVEIDGAEIEYSIVLDRAQIRFLDTRVEGSLIGHGARVTREFQTPRALRLTVGEGAQISFG
jgi:glucose-1-phosphate thymidylyltransferase